MLTVIMLCFLWTQFVLHAPLQQCLNRIRYKPINQNINLCYWCKNDLSCVIQATLL